MRNGAATKPIRKMSVKAYLAFEEQADVRHEYVDGDLISMPGTTDTHNTICGNIYIALRSLLKNTSCRVFMENVKVQITDKKHYTYPDIFVTCDERDNADSYIKKYPSVIIEVASPSTKVYDKTDKFLEYRKIASLRHYLIVDTEKEIVECYSSKDGKEWTAEFYTSKNEAVSLDSIGKSLSLAAIYE
ncbi:MAG: Uma2 family endonuclease [Saprospiraceae bacterium]|nr:Uma2 family endonuclease [Saprospiraceae bacterium]MCF8250907.1 Uma2 family endonuclease [Saprospiraceae bacterium]MCF8282706.1 Uma2 family endonuclease [Bacteroidales bacterium]MCF8311872.1 Uma2 family endonuclease [Saprospiraceae bacterium]MCF8443014.1 Uma2 family endonuclease [Saprospiraceae bacterium]